MIFSDDELRAIANAATKVASSASVLRQAVEPRDVRRWAKTTCFAIWRLAFAVSPNRFPFNIWEQQDFPALLRPEWPELGGLLTRIRWAAQRIAECVGVYQLVEYRPTKLEQVGDEHVFGFVGEIRGGALMESIRDLHDAGTELKALIDATRKADIHKKIRHRKSHIETFLKQAEKSVSKGERITAFVRRFAEKRQSIKGCTEEALMKAWERHKKPT